MQSLDALRRRGRVEERIDLAPLTTYKFGGPARYLVTIDEVDDLRDAWDLADALSLPVVALGRGSNVVVADDGFEGIVVRAGPGLSARSFEDGAVVAGAGAPLPLLARESVRAGRGRLEFFAGIPGSVGGAVRMNAGCHGSETGDVLIHAVVFDARTGAISERDPESLGMRYRHSDLGDDDFVVEARFATIDQPAAVGEREIREITRWRKEHQPGGTLNAGSVFKNPTEGAAGRIIDELGLKGLRCGDVAVSERHANFFVAGPAATAGDVFELVALVRTRVETATGITLEPEIRFIGDFA